MGSYHSCALRIDGTVICFGDGTTDQNCRGLDTDQGFGSPVQAVFDVSTGLAVERRVQRAAHHDAALGAPSEDDSRRPPRKFVSRALRG
jgi:hypothetical protein